MAWVYLASSYLFASITSLERHPSQTLGHCHRLGSEHMAFPRVQGWESKPVRISDKQQAFSWDSQREARFPWDLELCSGAGWPGAEAAFPFPWPWGVGPPESEVNTEGSREETRQGPISLEPSGPDLPVTGVAKFLFLFKSVRPGFQSFATERV